ncbi:hypothetical protein ABEB36_012990 [Hypothenemus hampei]|uniref:Uncharacterized protein n=1 Tax=Hypothenemus hampei TaxID=57062 RepID=A0ABD1E6F8_HYPHA
MDLTHTQEREKQPQTCILLDKTDSKKTRIIHWAKKITVIVIVDLRNIIFTDQNTTDTDTGTDRITSSQCFFTKKKYTKLGKWYGLKFWISRNFHTILWKNPKVF